jgi:hypothetical protein
MPKPFQSKLIAYEAEIAALRATRPPTPYARIAEILRKKYALSAHRDTIHSFVRVRSHGRKVFCFARPLEASCRDLNAKTSAGREPSDLGLSALSATDDVRPRPRFNYTPSDRYNLTRLTPEQVTALKKRLEGE